MPILNVNQKRVAKPKPGLGDASDYTEMVLRNAQVSVQPIGVPRLSPTGNFLKFVPFWPAKRMYEEKLEYLNRIDDPPPYIPYWTTYGGCWTLTTNPPDATTSAFQTCNAKLAVGGPFYAVLSQPFRGMCEFTPNVRYDTDIGFMIDPSTKLNFRIRPYVPDANRGGRGPSPPAYPGTLLVYDCGPMLPQDGSQGFFKCDLPAPPGFYAPERTPIFVQDSDRLRIEITKSDTPVKYWTRDRIASNGGNDPRLFFPQGDGTTTDIIKVYIVSGAVDGTGKYIGGGTVRYLTYIPIPPGLLTDGGLYPFVSSLRDDDISGVGINPDEYKDFIFI